MGFSWLIHEGHEPPTSPGMILQEVVTVQDKRRLIGLSTVSLPSDELPGSIEAEVAPTHQIGKHHGDATIDTQTTMYQNVGAVLEFFYGRNMGVLFF